MGEHMNKQDEDKYLEEDMMDSYEEEFWEESVEEFMPKEVYKHFLRKLISYMNEEEVKKIVSLLVSELGKNNSNLKLSEDIETALIQFGIDKAI